MLPGSEQWACKHPQSSAPSKADQSWILALCCPQTHTCGSLKRWWDGTGQLAQKLPTPDSRQRNFKHRASILAAKQCQHLAFTERLPPCMCFQNRLISSDDPLSSFPRIVLVLVLKSPGSQEIPQSHANLDGLSPCDPQDSKWMNQLGEVGMLDPRSHSSTGHHQHSLFSAE